MKRRFVICVDDSTGEQQNAVTDYLKKKKCRFWHYFSDLWLVTSDAQDISAEGLRAEISEIIPSTSKFVMEVGDGSWAAQCEKKSHNWLHESWSDRSGD